MANLNEAQIVLIGVLGGAVGGLGGAYLQKGIEQPKIDALNQEKQTYVFSGNGGGATCDKDTGDSNTANKTFESKEIAGDSKLRHLLTLEKDHCTVWLMKPNGP